MKKFFAHFYLNLFLATRLFVGIGICATLFVLKFFWPQLADLPYFAFLLLIAFFVLDLLLLYGKAKGVFAQRTLPERLSNGDENELAIYVENLYPFPVKVGVIEEIPYQFQRRDVWFKAQLKAGGQTKISYQLRPVKRGEYDFGQTRVFVSSPLGLISRRYNFSDRKLVPVYPSFLRLRQFELMAIGNRLSEMGIKKIRRLGHSMEFDQVKNYTSGDDYRSINWKATARHGNLMVNGYIDEKSQNVYCVIDKSRVMQMPFDGMTLLDYAINASLVLSSIALLKHDNAGLLTIAEKMGTSVKASRRTTQLQTIMEALYKEKTRFLEADLGILYQNLRKVATQRSLVVFFTNFESLDALKRQLPYLMCIAKYHLLMIVFFENTALRQTIQRPASDVEGIYIKTIAEKFDYEKRLMVKELMKHGILSLLTSPENLTVNVINRYLDIKLRNQL